MDTFINQYLGKVDRYLKALSTSERVDIVKEIKSQIVELQNNGKSTEEIVARLGSPKDLAKAYLGESIAKSTEFSWKKFCAVVAYYGLVGTVWMFILPITSIMGITFMGCGLITPVAGLIKFIAFFLGHDIPEIQFSMGSYSASAITFLPISIVVGVTFFVIGKLLWVFTINIIKTLNKAKAKI